MAPARPRWLATTTGVAVAGEVTGTAPATGAEATVATPAGTQREEDSLVILVEATEVAVPGEEEGTEEQAGATEEAMGMLAGVAGSDSRSVKSFHFNKSAFPSQSPVFLFLVCMGFSGSLVEVQFCNISCP